MTAEWTGYRMLVCEVGLMPGAAEFVFVLLACLFALFLVGIFNWCVDLLHVFAEGRRNGR